MLAALALTFATGCGALGQGEETDRSGSAPAGERSGWRPASAREKVEIDELLKRTATFRRNKARPQWENLTTDDFICSRPFEWKLPRDFDIPECISLRACTLEREGGPSVWLTVDPENGRLHAYYWQDAEDLVRQERDKGELRPVSLTPADAVEQAKEYVRAITGNFPNDLVLDSMYVPGPVPNKEREPADGAFGPGTGDTDPDVLFEIFWEVRFSRYAGAVPYESQAVLIRFSEQYGVLSYTSQYFDKWEGEVTVGAEKAIAIAEKAHEKNPGNSYWYFPDQANPLREILELPMYVRNGRPSLMHVVKEDPRAVRAVWTVLLPYALLYEKSTPGALRWQEAELYVDAETGEFLGVKEYD